MLGDDRAELLPAYDQRPDRYRAGVLPYIWQLSSFKLQINMLLLVFGGIAAPYFSKCETILLYPESVIRPLRGSVVKQI